MRKFRYTIPAIDFWLSFHNSIVFSIFGIDVRFVDMY